MTPSRRVLLALSPPAQVSKRDTSLRFTDILFGFVIREIFLRLQHWNDLDSVVRWQLVVSSALVLGSWIGFRRSVNRSDYEPKFVNLPLLRFVLDQLMVILYFRISTLSTVEAPFFKGPPTTLAEHTLGILVLIFLIYLAWDALGIWMACAKDRVEDPRDPKYPQIDQKGEKTNPPVAQPANGVGLVITLVTLALLFGLKVMADDRAPWVTLALATTVLLVYRMAKDVRTSWAS